jgi:arachidonate 15-lipoxygenase
MAAAPQTISPSSDPGSDRELEKNRRDFTYRKPAENQLAPMASADDYPWRAYYSIGWLLRLGSRTVGAQTVRGLQLLRFGAQRLTWRFDKMRAYRQILGWRRPAFVEQHERDDLFAWWRVAGANALSLTQVSDLRELDGCIRLDVRHIEARLAAGLDRAVSLEAEANAGHLFVVDFKLLQRALRPGPEAGRPVRCRDSRWRAKYFPASIGVFLEAPGFKAEGFEGACDLVPLAIQIDQIQRHPTRGERNPVVYPGKDPGAWKIAKAYFEVSDLNFHVFCGHVQRSHLAMEPFALATPRQLPKRHPVRVLLEPHLRFTIPVNRAAYKYFIKRSKTYYAFYAGTLEESRAISIESYFDTGFRAMDLEADLAARGVTTSPRCYPYRDDARLWRGTIQRFVRTYVEACFASDADVAGDAALQAWAAELVDPDRGAVRDLLPDSGLVSREALTDLLAQVIHTAGPGHAAQHYASNHFYRYAPAFPGAAYVPPNWSEGPTSEARLQNLFPPIRVAARQWTYNTFTNFRYDRFGRYGRSALGRMPEAQPAVRALEADLKRIEESVCRENKNGRRPYPYEFLLPSQVPNSINI